MRGTRWVVVPYVNVEFMKEIFSFIADNDYCGIANYVEHYGMTIV